MDNTESDQEASTQSSPEDSSRQIDLRAIGSPTLEPLSLVRIDRSPPEEGKEEERESTQSEIETPRRRIRFSTPISTRIPDPPSPLPPFEEETSTTMSAARMQEEIDELRDQLVALNAAFANALAAPRGKAQPDGTISMATKV